MFILFLQNYIVEKYFMSVITNDECLLGTSFIKRADMYY